MGNIVKLQNAGESVTWTIAKAETTAGNFGPQVKFESTDGEVLYLPEDSANRQLSRIPLSVAECVGETLVISRDPNPKPGAKPYWGIRLAGAQDKAPPSPRIQSPYQAPSGGAKHIKGLDDFPDEEYGRSVQSPSGPEDSPYDNPGPIPPFHKAHAAAVAPNAADRMKVAREYLDLLAWVKTQPETKGMSDEAVQASAATIWIQWGRKGLA